MSTKTPENTNPQQARRVGLVATLEDGALDIQYMGNPTEGELVFIGAGIQQKAGLDRISRLEAAFRTSMENVQSLLMELMEAANHQQQQQEGNNPEEQPPSNETMTEEETE
jgi:hypothetical protein